MNATQPSLRHKTLLDALECHAYDHRTIRFVDDSGQVTSRSRSAIREAAKTFASLLKKRGIVAGDPVLMALPTGEDFVAAFLGTLYVGAYPVPLGLPTGFGDLDSFSGRVATIGNFLQAKALVTGPGLKDAAMVGLKGAVFIDPTDATREHLEPFSEAGTAQPETLALLQCTSGSTGTPKAVALSHGNLIANLAQIGGGVHVAPLDVVVSWLPLNHDMGLIGCFLFSLYWGLDLVLMSPSRFLRRPASWLRAISDYRGTLSPAPNFAYAYATARVRDEELAGVDLTSWRVAFCGAEPIDARTLHGFHDRFENHGLRKDVILPCYGLAEASLAVTFHESGMPFRSERLDREALSAGMAMQTEPKQSSDGSPISGVEPVEVVSCGRPLKGTELRIVGPGGEDLDEGRVGRIVLRGPSVMKGYFGDAERSASTLQNGWLDSGDMGYLRDGQLYVTGREKDVIILRGKCYAPTEFEWPASETPGVRKGCAVAFGAFDPKHGTEVLHVVCETEVTTEEERARLREEVARRIALRAGVRPEVVRLVRRDAIPKTTSGKVQRSKTKAFCTESRPSSHWKVA